MNRVNFAFFLLALLTGIATAQLAPPAPGVEVPAIYFQIVQENPNAFQFERAWIAETQKIRIRREAFLKNSRNHQLDKPAGQIRVSGVKRVPVLLGNFANNADVPFPAVQLQRELFDGPWPTGTLTEYYREISYGNITLTGNVSEWVTVTHTDTFYEGRSNGLGSDAHTGQFLKEVLDANDPAIDFGQYDNDGPDGMPNSGDDDGFVDFVAFVHPESGGECGSSNIWSHRWTYGAWWNGASYQTGDAAANGGFIQVQDYVIQPGVDCAGANMIEKGIFCHEFGHAFGLPDLYDLDQSSEGIGNWCLMASGNWNSPDSPAHMSVWCKEQLGWIIPEIISPAGDSLSNAGPNAVLQTQLSSVEFQPEALKIPIDSSGDEYFLLENRQAAGFDRDLPGSGLLIWHVDNRKSSNRREWYPGLDPRQHFQVALVQADGAWDLEHRNNRGDGGDPFQSSDFSCASTPNSDTYVSGASDVAIRKIHSSEDQISVEISFFCLPAKINVHPSIASIRLRAGETGHLSFTIANTGDDGAANLEWNLWRGAPVNGATSPVNLILANMRKMISENNRSGSDLQKGAVDPRAGSAAITGSGGSDEFGYHWQSSDSQNVLFAWQDISTSGQSLSLKDDDFVGVTLPFVFPFYGKNFTTVNISSNGFLSFDFNSDEYRHQMLPDARPPNGVIAALWRDLDPTLGGSGYYFEDAENQRFIVQFTDISAYANRGNFTFQIILYHTGEIRFQYLRLTGEVNTGTVGIESPDGKMALPIVFNRTFLHDSLSLRIFPGEVYAWLSPAPPAGNLAPGESQTVLLNVNTGGLPSGDQTGMLTVYSNDPETPAVEIPITLTVATAISLRAKVYLQGAFRNGKMSDDLANKGLLPLEQPYAVEPWKYAGDERVAQLPPAIVDWMLVTLCDSPSRNNAIVRRACFLDTSGALVDLDGASPLSFENVPAGQYYLLIEHRNHLSVMSRVPLLVGEAAAFYDFTSSDGQAFGFQPQATVAPGIYAMRAGDADANDAIDIRDKNLFWRVQKNQSANYDNSADFNLDGVVDEFDIRGFWRKNNGRASQALK